MTVADAAKVVLFMFHVSCGSGSEEKGDLRGNGRGASEKDPSTRGHRFRVLADVDGNGRQDTLFERFIDPSTGQEADKFIADASYDALTSRIWRLKPHSFVECSDTNVGRLLIREGQSFGLAHLVNEGDLNGDGRDEIGWVGHWADYSNMNTCHITSWSGNGWVELASFDIAEWQLSEIPGTAEVSDQPPADLVWLGEHGRVHALGMAEAADLDTLLLTLAPLLRR